MCIFALNKYIFKQKALQIKYCGKRLRKFFQKLLAEMVILIKQTKFFCCKMKMYEIY